MTVYLTSSRERLPQGFKLFLHLTFHDMCGHHTLRDSIWQPKLCKPFWIATDVCIVPIHTRFYLQKNLWESGSACFVVIVSILWIRIHTWRCQETLKDIQLRGIKSRSELEFLWHQTYLLPKWLRNSQEKQESPSIYSYFKMYLILWQIFVTTSESISVLFLPLTGGKGFSCHTSAIGCTDSSSTM